MIRAIEANLLYWSFSECAIWTKVLSVYLIDGQCLQYGDMVTNFTGQRKAAKISPVKFQVHNRCGWELDHENFIHKFIFEQNLAKP